MEKKNIWVIARQHPGETMAEWFIEGLLESLLDSDNPTARSLLQHCRFHVVPNMNPGGSRGTVYCSIFFSPSTVMKELYLSFDLI